MDEGQLYGIMIGDSLYDSPRTSIGRANGAHRIATLLRKHSINIEVIDFFNSWEITELNQFILNFGSIDFLGISIGLSQLNNKKVNFFIKTVRNINPKIKIIAGGSRVTGMKFESVDYYFRGFADGAINDIVKYLRTGKINTLIVEEIKTHDIKKVIDCNKHYLNYDLSNLKTEYTTNDFIMPNESLTIESGRGCIFKCKFCNFPLTGKKKNDYIREKEDIKTELINNYEKWGTTKYTITDDTFNDNEYKVQIMYDISNELPFKPEYVCYTRVDLLHSKPHTLEQMIGMGVRAMFFGIESLTPSTSKEMRKLFTGEKLKNFLFKLRNTYPELHLTGSFIVGLPNESIEMMEDNLDWAMKNKIFDSIIAFPLYIPIDENVDYLSPFSKEWREHGYDSMSVDEINNIVYADPNKFKSFLNINFENLNKHYVPWKNSNMNFLEASVHATRIKKKIEPNVTLSAFGCFGSSFSSVSFTDLLKQPKSQLDWDTIKSDAVTFVNEYKHKKLNIVFN